MPLKKYIKLILSFTMLGIVVAIVDFQDLSKTFSKISLNSLLAMFFGYSLGQVISAFKWWNIAKSAGIDSSFPKALKSYFLGMYVNSFGFGILGGDVARGLLIASGTSKKSAGLASVVADRVHGLAVLCLIGIISTAFFDNDQLNPIIKLSLYLIVAVLITCWFLGPKVLRKLLPGEKFAKLGKIAEDISSVFPKNPSKIALISLVSAIFHLSQIGLHWIMAQALNVDISFSYLLVVVPFINLATSLPISWQGLGVRENAYAYFLVPLFITNDQAIAFGAMWFFSVISSSAIGGIIATLSGDLKTLQSEKTT